MLFTNISLNFKGCLISINSACALKSLTKCLIPAEAIYCVLNIYYL
nr:MAG TPA: hypothetical protein [Caudoviricetes sp.]